MTTTLSLDLGCGTKRRPGFIGVDRFRLAGAHALADLDAPHLPFGDDTFTLILSFHSLEHVADLMSAMAEIWRIARPEAQLVIAAPYGASHLNVANPYHKQVFNEHTPRFWTSAPDSAIDPEEWQEAPLGTQWGLAESDHSKPGFDFRCVAMEFFYFAPYRGLSSSQQRQYRKRRINVCEQILYHLVVRKPIGDEAARRAPAADLYVPPELEARRNATANDRKRRAWRLWR